MTELDDSHPEPDVEECLPVEPVDMLEIELFDVSERAKEDASFRVDVGVDIDIW